MPLTVREILAFDVVQQAEPEIVAGMESLDRVVRWVHISELSDIAHLLRGGELLLTTGMGLENNSELQQRYIRELAAVGIAGIVIELGRTFAGLPDAMIRESERHHIPLIALKREVRFVEVTEAVHSTIINRQLDLLEKAEKIRQDFTDLVQHGAGANRIVHRLAEIVQNPVVLEDRAHQVMEYATHTGSVDGLLEGWESHSRRGHECTTGSAATIQEGTPRCAWMPLIARGEVCGRVHVLEQDSPLDEMDLHAVDRAACIIGFTLLADKDADQLATHARGALISEIVHDRYSSSDEVIRRCRALGCDLEGKTVVAMVAGTGNLDRRERSRQVTDEERHRLHGNLLEEIRRGFIATRSSVLATLDGDKILAVVGVPPVPGAKETFEAMWSEVGPRVARRLDGLALVIGVSGPGTIERLNHAFDEAREALRYGMGVGRKSGIYRLDASDLQYLLLRLSNSIDLAQFVESELAPILEHDAQRGTVLLPTLRTYLDCGGSKSSAARALHIERRSLYHRLQRITELLHRDLDDPEIRASLIVALRGLDVLKHGRAEAARRN